MRILVLFAHPVETSFAAAAHAKLVATLSARGHQVDDCDLYAEGFDPVMSREDRIDYHDVAVNRRRVAPYVDRLLAAEALVFSFPVWNMGFPAILKGFVDKVFLPGVSFSLQGQWRLRPDAAQHQAPGRRLHLRRQPLMDRSDGRSAAPVPDPLDAADLRSGRALRLCRPLRHEPHQARAPRAVPEVDRGEVLDLVTVRPGIEIRTPGQLRASVGV